MSYIGNPIVSTDFPVDYASGNGSTTAFTLSVAPASVNSIDVQISGVSQSPQTYSVSGTTLTFSAAPPTGTNNIVVRHLGVAGIPNTPSAGSVVTASIADANVTQAKLASGVSGTGPVFGAYASANQSLTSATFTKIQLNIEEFDTASCFNNTGSTVGGIPAYSFLPNVAGYYMVTGAAVFTGTVTRLFCSIYKNTTEYKRGNDLVVTGYQAGVSSIVYLNGTTDYISLYGYASGTGLGIEGASIETYMSASLIRSA